MTAALEPMAAAIRPDSRPKRNIVTVRGSRKRPDWMMLAPNPYPADLGVCRNSGRKAMTEYMPIPNRNATRLFVHTAGTRIIFMSMRGWREPRLDDRPGHADDDGERDRGRSRRAIPSPSSGLRSHR